MINKSVSTIVSLFMVLTMWTLMPVDVNVEGSESPNTSGQTIWDHEVPFRGTREIDGIATGEIYMDKTGDETVITSRDGGTYIIYLEDGQWIKEKIWESPGQQLTPAIGDLRTDKPGNEILVVGLSSGSEKMEPGDGTATVLIREGTSWVAERAYTDDELIHGCAIGDIDPTIPGVEAVLTTFNYTTVMTWWDNDHWNSSFMFSDSHNIRKAVIADLIDTHEGNEVICISKSGNATLAYGTVGNWTSERIYQGESLARVAVGDVDPDPGLEIYLGLDVFDGRVIGLKWTGTEWINQTVFTDTDKNRGVWTGDVDPAVPGNELYTFGYSTRLVQITVSFALGWNSRELFLDTARGHEIRVGDIHPEIPGNEIGIVGYSRNLTVVYPSEWVYEVPFTGTDPIDGLAIGEIYPDKEGFETVITSRDGGTYISYKEDGNWKNEKIWESPGQQLTPAIGDLIPEREGNEILVVGLSSGDEDNDPGDGTATVLYRDGTSWVPTRAFTDDFLIHGCDIGDLDPNHEGMEAVLTTFNFTAVMIWWENGEWHNDLIFTDSHNVRKAVIADLIDTHEGNEVICVSKSGNATLAYGTTGNWTIERIYSGIPLARVAVGNVDPDPGVEIYLGGDVATGSVIGLKWTGTEWIDTVVFEDTAKNRGVWTGDVDPDVPGQELYAYGYSTKLTQIIDPFGTGRSSKEIVSDTARGHEIRIGDLDPEKEGNEIGIVGYSKRLVVVSLRDEGEPVVPTLTGEGAASLNHGESASVDLMVDGESYMTLEVSEIEGARISLHPESVFIKGSVKLMIEAEHVKEDITEDVTITLHHIGGTVTYTISISITGDSSKPVVDMTSVSADDAITWEELVNVTLSEPVTRSSFGSAIGSGNIRLEVEGVVQNVVFTLSDDRSVISLSMTEDVGRGDTTLTINGLMDDAGNEMGTFTLDIEIKKEESDDPGPIWLVILIMTLLLIVLTVLIMVFASFGKKKEDEDDSPELPIE